MNLCDSCKKDGCKWRAANGEHRGTCLYMDPITRADLAARDAEIEALREEVRLTNEHEHAIMMELSAARDEIADLKRDEVVVPELPAETALALIAIDWPNRTIDIIATARNIREWFRKSARTIPADRVLGEGEVAQPTQEPTP